MKQGYGSSDSDKVGKEIADKPLRGPGTDVDKSALVGGVSNRTGPNPNEKGGKSADQGSRVQSPSRDSIAPYKEGGFRNAAMEHKR